MNNVDCSSPQRQQNTSIQTTPEQEKNKQKEILSSNGGQQSAIQSNQKKSALKNQNIKLRNQVMQLVIQVNEIMKREHAQRRHGISCEEGIEDEDTRIWKLQLKKEQINIMQLKNKIVLGKRQLEFIHDSTAIQQKQNTLKVKQRQLYCLKQEKKALLKVKKHQNQAILLISADKEFQEKVKKAKEQASKIRQQCKIIHNKNIQLEKKLRKKHQKNITQKQKEKKMFEKIKKSKQKIEKDKTQNIVTVEMVAEIQKQIVELEKDKRQSEKTWSQKIENLQSELRMRRIDEEKKLLMLKEKDKEVRLNDLRLRELRKLSTYESCASQNVISELQSGCYRRKRNHKYSYK